MKIGDWDRRIWVRKHLPAALLDEETRSCALLINPAINDRAGVNQRKNPDLNNAVSLLRFANRNGNPGPLAFMEEIIATAHPTSAGRIKWYKRWLRRAYGIDFYSTHHRWPRKTS